MTQEVQAVVVNGALICVKEYEGRRIVTFKDVDAAHGRPEGTAKRNFNTNKEHFIEGEDYFVRNSYEAMNEFGITAPNGLTLITETGYLMLVKSFTDDLAWAVQRELVNSYFGARNATAKSRDDIARMRAENERLKLEMQAKQLEITQRNSEHKAEMERETQARLAEKERLKADEAKRRDKRNDAEQLLKLIQSKRIFGKPLAEAISKFYELSTGEEFSSEALNELFTVTKEHQLDAYPKICNIVHEKAEMFDNAVWGKFSTDRKTVYIIKAEFDKFCKEVEIPSKPMLAWLGEKGLIELDAQGQYTKPVSIKGRLARCVVMRLDANA